MSNINASALNSLQTRINAERSRRSLSPVTFTDGTHSAGDIIKATHFNELRSYTEGLNTLGSQTFNWSGNISAGANITDVLTQIDNFVTTLENEALAGWHVLTPNIRVQTTYQHYYGFGSVNGNYYTDPQGPWTNDTFPKKGAELVYEIPSQIYGTIGTLKVTYNGGITAPGSGGYRAYASVHYLTPAGWAVHQNMNGVYGGMDFFQPFSFNYEISTGSPSSLYDSQGKAAYPYIRAISYNTYTSGWTNPPLEWNNKWQNDQASAHSSGMIAYYYDGTEEGQGRRMQAGSSFYSEIAPSETNRYVQAVSFCLDYPYSNPYDWVTIEAYY